MFFSMILFPQKLIPLLIIFAQKSTTYYSMQRLLMHMHYISDITKIKGIIQRYKM